MLNKGFLDSNSSLEESLALSLDFSSCRFLLPSLEKAEPSLEKAEPVLRAISKSSITRDMVLASGSGLSLDLSVITVSVFTVILFQFLH